MWFDLGIGFWVVWFVGFWFIELRWGGGFYFVGFGVGWFGFGLVWGWVLGLGFGFGVGNLGFYLLGGVGII